MLNDLLVWHSTLGSLQLKCQPTAMAIRIRLIVTTTIRRLLATILGSGGRRASGARRIIPHRNYTSN